MKIVVETLTGTLLHTEVADDATVGILKREIASQENLPHERLILYLDNDRRGLLNNDDLSLAEYGVQDSSHIYLFFHPVVDDAGSEVNVDIMNEGFAYLSDPIPMSGDDYLFEGEISGEGFSPNEKEAKIISVNPDNQKSDQPAASLNVFETLTHADEDND